MSRYEIPTLAPAETTCVVGWDNPLQTFFAQVERVTPDDDEPEILLWIGVTASECLHVAKLAEEVAPWATLPADIAATLEGERDRAPAPSRLQATLHNLVNRR